MESKIKLIQEHISEVKVNLANKHLLCYSLYLLGITDALISQISDIITLEEYRNYLEQTRLLYMALISEINNY